MPERKRLSGIAGNAGEAAPRLILFPRSSLILTGRQFFLPAESKGVGLRTDNKVGNDFSPDGQAGHGAPGIVRVKTHAK